MARPSVGGLNFEPYQISFLGPSFPDYENERKSKHVAKKRECMNCQRTFKSEWAGHRRCEVCLRNPYRLWSRIGKR